MTSVTISKKTLSMHQQCPKYILGNEAHQQYQGGNRYQIPVVNTYVHDRGVCDHRPHRAWKLCNGETEVGIVRDAHAFDAFV